MRDRADGHVVVDGNAILGALTETLGTDISAVVVVCRYCGHRGPGVDVVVYLSRMGAVARCRGCGEVLYVLIGAGVGAGTGRLSLPGVVFEGPRPTGDDAAARS